MKNNIHILALALCVSTAYSMQKKTGTHSSQLAASPQIHRFIPTLQQLAGTIVVPKLLDNLQNQQAEIDCSAQLLIKNPQLADALLPRYYTLHTFIDHQLRVNCLAYAPYGLSIANGLRNRTTKICDIQTRQCQQTLIGHTQGDDFNIGINCLAYSPDGLCIATGSSDKTIKIWDANTGQCQQTLTGHKLGINCLAYAPNGLCIATGSSDKTIKIWDANTGQCQQTLIGHKLRINCLAYAPNGLCIATGSSDKTIKLWDANTGQCQQTLTGHTLRVNCLAYAPDGLCIATGSSDKTIKLWRQATVTVRLIIAYMKHHNLTTREQLPAYMHKAFDTIPEQSHNEILKYGLQNDEDK